MENILNEGVTSFIAKPVDLSEFPAEGEKDVISAIGHADTAKILGYSFNRVTVKAAPGDQLYVAQLRCPQGARLPEGTTALPDNFRFDFYLIEIVK